MPLEVLSIPEEVLSILKVVLHILEEVLHILEYGNNSNQNIRSLCSKRHRAVTDSLCSKRHGVANTTSSDP